MLKYLLAAILFVVLDGFYLNFVKDYFNSQVKKIQGTPIKINLIYTAITYVFLIFGLNYFIIQKHRPVKDAALLGLVIYGVYEFTNYTVFRQYDWKFAIADTVWGGILFVCSRYLLKHVF